MKTIRILIVLALAGTLSPHLFAQSDSQAGQREFVKGEVIVEIVPEASISAINARYGTAVKQRLYNTNFYLLTTPNGRKEKKWRKRLKKDPEIISAELNPVVTSPAVFGRSTFGFPDGIAKPGYTSQDFLSQSDLFTFLQRDEVKKRSTGRGIVVAVIDTGVDRTHPDLTGSMWSDTRQGGDASVNSVDEDGDGLTDDVAGWDFVGKDNDPSEIWNDPKKTVAGHGTFIARIITMLAPDARIMPIRAVDTDGIADAFVVATAIKYAVDHGADVINLSLGAPDVAPLLEAAIQDANDHGVLLVAAVGNDNSDKAPQYPSSSSSVMAVAAIDLHGHKTQFSNYGTHVDLCAPGSELVSAFPAEKPGPPAFALWSGTSFAAPFVAAEAALILQVVDPGNVNVTEVMEATAVSVDEFNEQSLRGKLGRGSMNPLEALKKVNAPLTGAATDRSDTIDLIRTSQVLEGRGSATIKTSGTNQSFSVEASNLPVRRGYSLIVNGIEIRINILPTVLGSFIFTSATASATQPPVLPVTDIHKVEVRDPAGVVLLQGEFKAETDAKRVLKQASLFSPGDTAVSGGVANARLIGAHQELSVQAEGLTAGASYSITVDGVFLGSFIASSTRFGGGLFTNDGTGQVLPAALRPVTNIRIVEIHDQNRQLVRRGEFRLSAVNAVAR